MKQKQEDVIAESKKDFVDVFQIKEKREFSKEEVESIYAQLNSEEQTIIEELYSHRTARTTAHLYYRVINEIWCDFLAKRVYRDKSISSKWFEFLKEKKRIQVNKDLDNIISNRSPILIHPFDSDAELSEKDKSLLQAEFLRMNSVKVPTSRTVQRIIENLWEIGFLTKREQSDKVPSKSKTYWAIRPQLYVLLKKLWGY